MRPSLLVLPLAACLAGQASLRSNPAELRIGMIGLDTSHAISIASLLNDPGAKGHVAGGRVAWACKDASPDMERSRSRVDRFASELRDKFHVQLLDSVAEVVSRSDAIIIESVDGRAHLRQARQVFPSGKPVFLDKPLAANLADAVAIVRLARQTHTPLLSASPFRFARGLRRLAEARIGGIRGAVSYGNGTADPKMPPLFFEGIHSVEALFTVLGPGCQTLTCLHTPDSEVVSAVWSDGRTGVVYALSHGAYPYGVTVFGKKETASDTTFFEEGFQPLASAMIGFFRTRRSPVPLENTLEIIAFLEAADLSRRHGGSPVDLPNLLRQAETESE